MTKEFWKATGIRCLRTFITSIIAGWTGDTLITEINWKATLVIAISATFYIFLLCILAGLPEVELTDTLYALDNDPDEEDELDEDSEVWEGDE